MARKTGGAAALIGVGLGVAGFFLLRKQPITGSVIKVIDDGVNQLFKGMTPAQSQAAQTAGAPPANVDSEPIRLGDILTPGGISLASGGPKVAETESGAITSLPDWIPLITGFRP